MAAPTGSVEAIRARVISREAMMHPTLRGLWLIQGLGALLVALLLLFDYFQVALPVSFEFLAVAGPPLRVLAAITLGIEGGFVAQRFAKHKEPPYPQFAQSSALGLSSAGAIMMGAGLVMSLVWASLFSGYYPQASVVGSLGPALVLSGAAAMLAGLPTLATSVIRPLILEGP